MGELVTKNNTILFHWTNGTKFIWGFSNKYGTQFGINFIPGFFGISISILPKK